MTAINDRQRANLYTVYFKKQKYANQFYIQKA